jgi:predicted secreted hydrolase
MTPEQSGKNERTKANYPISWRIAVPEEQLEFSLRPVMPNQELVLDPLIYWEGLSILKARAPENPSAGGLP